MNIRNVFTATIICLFMLSVTAGALTGEGVLTVGSGITATGVWDGTYGYDAAKMAWSVEQSEALTGGWHYHYELSVGRGDISHMILETSIGFTLNDLHNLVVNNDFNYGTYEIGDWPTESPNDGDTSTPYIPGNIHGVKFESNNSLVLTIDFDSYRQAVWGDFYAKDGTAGTGSSLFNASWNTGFEDADSSLNHILVPDTVTGGGAIPEAGTLPLFGTGLATMMSGLRLKRARARRK